MMGWCEECEKEGKDPQHNRTTSLCSRHYEQQRLKLNKQEIYARRKAQRRNQGWCPECEAEGSDPVHSRTTILCGKHHQRKYTATEHGKKKRGEYALIQAIRRSPLKRAVHEEKRDDSPTG